MNWIRFSIAVSGFLVVALIFGIVMIRREFQNVIERLFIYLLLATLIRETVLASNVEHQFEYKNMKEVCSVLGALNLYTALLVLIYVASTVTYLLSRVVGHKLLCKGSKSTARFFEIGFVIVTFLVPLIISMSLLYLDIFGLSTAWCWMHEYDNECRKVNILKKIFGGYSVLLIVGILGVIFTVIMVIIYWKIARKIKKAKHLLKQALILVIALLLNFIILIFSSFVILAPIGDNYILLVEYVYTTVMSLYDLVYPLAFLVVVKYHTVLSAINNKRRHSSYTRTPLHESHITATSPFSTRVSARSTTVAISAQFTGQFTNM